MVINRAILPGYDPGDNGPFWGAITMWSYNVTNFGRPGNRFFRNIFQMDQTGQPVPVFGGQWYDKDNKYETEAGWAPAPPSSPLAATTISFLKWIIQVKCGK